MVRVLPEGVRDGLRFLPEGVRVELWFYQQEKEFG